MVQSPGGGQPSLGGYFTFAADTFGGNWWFIPTLIPFLFLSPFLYMFFESISDECALKICVFFLTVSIWSCLSHLGQWFFLTAGRPGGASLVKSISYLIPTHLIPNSYIVTFCSGYFLRRLLPSLDELKQRKLLITGIVFWFLDVLTIYIGIGSSDPSDYWLWTVIAIFIIFNRLNINAASLPGKIISWTGRRSYTIYLLQFPVIVTIGPVMYSGAFFGSIHPCRGSLVWLFGLRL